MFVDPESHCSCWMKCRYGFILINNWFQELMETRTNIGGTTNQVCVTQCCLASCSHLLHFPSAQACHWAKVRSGFDEELKASMATTSIFICTNYKLQLGCWKRALKSFRLINSIFHSAICVSVFEVCSLPFPGCQAHTMTVTEAPRLICWETAIDSQSLLCRWIKLQKRMVWKNVGAYHWINFLNAQVDWDFFIFFSKTIELPEEVRFAFYFPSFTDWRGTTWQTLFIHHLSTGEGGSSSPGSGSWHRQVLTCRIWGLWTTSAGRISCRA